MTLLCSSWATGMTGDTSVGGGEHGSISKDHLALVDFRQMDCSEVELSDPVVSFFDADERRKRRHSPFPDVTDLIASISKQGVG